MSSLNNPLKRSSVDGQIMPLQYYDEALGEMIVVTSATPVPIMANTALDVNNEVLSGAKEQFTKGIRSIDTDHAYIHEGIFYHSTMIFTLNTNTTRSIALITPSGSNAKFIHYRNESVSSSADKVTVELYEDANIDVETGTPITPINHNRLSNNQSAMSVKDGVTVTSAGNLISQTYIGGGVNQGSHRIGGETDAGNEFILKQGKIYIIKVTNGSSGNNTIFIKTNWYEEGQGEYEV